CSNCHFYGGGGNSVKHGDLSATLFYPEPKVDVHMGKHNMDCSDCHRAPHHALKGRAMSVSPSASIRERIDCTDCHSKNPHKDVRLNKHTHKVSCQACHIPKMNPDDATKVTWDWSKAGQNSKVKDKHRYMKKKGRFTYQKGALPVYRWYNKMATHYVIGDKIDPTKVTAMDAPIGSRRMTGAKLWPFKVHLGRQIYDQAYKYFLVPNLIGKDGYWKKFDWDLALRNGAKVSKLPYSGKYGWAKTVMYWPLTHMVTAKEDALRCLDCHGPSGRLNWKELGYAHDPISVKHTFTHDAINLVDADETAVLESGKPVSFTKTCGSCHDMDEAFAKKHTYHRNLDLSKVPLERRGLLKMGVGYDNKGESEGCVLCHLEGASTKGFKEALAVGKSAWAATAALLGTKLVSFNGKTYTYNKAAFGDGEVTLKLGHTQMANCSGCHGPAETHDDAAGFHTHLDGNAWMSIKEGQAFAGMPIRRSAMNVAGRDHRAGPWDVHAERLVTCTDCHHNTTRPKQLEGVKIAKVKPGQRRSCRSCHDLTDIHQTLKEKKKHLAALTCEACHVPKLQLGGAKQLDFTTMHADGSPLVTWRGVKDGIMVSASTFIKPQDPILGFTKTVEGKKIAPFNIVGTWRWVDASGKAVATSLVRRAMLAKTGAFLPAVVAAFDANGDKKLSDKELRLDAPKKSTLISQRLAALGVKGPKIAGELQAFPVYHGVQWLPAKKGCARCHGSKKAPSTKTISLTTYLPGGVAPKATKDFTARMPGSVQKTAKGYTYQTKANAADLIERTSTKGKAK
ncbi:MAG: hypothetical protein KAI47_19305, partial [Deltaproteobacteria bacterium]|nr:hypothetical protein [Deltaproteobacteria bacterium]